jgi:hypothetical protein
MPLVKTTPKKMMRRSTRLAELALRITMQLTLEDHRIAAFQSLLVNSKVKVLAMINGNSRILEVLYHRRPYFVGIFPYIALT